MTAHYMNDIPNYVPYFFQKVFLGKITMLI